MTPVVLAGEGFTKRLPDRSGRGEVPSFRLPIEVIKHDVVQVYSRNPIAGSDANIAPFFTFNPCLLIHSVENPNDVISARCDLKKDRHLASSPNIVSIWGASALRDWRAKLMEFFRRDGKVVVRRRRSASKSQHKSKFFHGIDYTRFPRSAQGGAV